MIPTWNETDVIRRGDAWFGFLRSDGREGACAGIVGEAEVDNSLNHFSRVLVVASNWCSV